MIAAAVYSVVFILLIIVTCCLTGVLIAEVMVTLLGE